MKIPIDEIQDRRRRKGAPYKGRFTPKNPQKYAGDPTNIIYRSLWERKVMNWLDTNSAVLVWSSEEIAIPYLSPVDGRVHRYFPDFKMKARGVDGNTKTMILEVKPKKETREPEKQKRITKRYITEVVTWGKNQAKWKAAREYCLDRGWEFKLITEDELGIFAK
jgi:hypothetical protein